MASQQDVLGTLVLLHQQMTTAAASDHKSHQALQLSHMQKLLIEPFFADIW
jgi:hypothetical protein